MLCLDVQIAEAVLVDRFVHEIFIGLGQRVLPDADLDGDFPVAGRTDQLLIARVNDQRHGRGAELRVIQGKPKERVRIKQESQGMYSLKCSRCSSSSAKIVSIPLQRPGIGFAFSVGAATSFATGRLFSVITTSA